MTLYPSIAVGFVLALVDAHCVIWRWVENLAGNRKALCRLDLAERRKAGFVLVAVVTQLRASKQHKNDSFST